MLAATRLRQAGIPCKQVSVESTLTAFAVQQLTEVSKVRVGVYAFFDLVMHNVGVCQLDDIALGVLTTVISPTSKKKTGLWWMLDGWP
ncbi:hypothetical protein [Sodalis-like endosymbiont of Proechinophthirus fluctus]|uniref:hypothetical protein n=1 Tax=Sodalis-like endosymbiont of Proechinophthirus fluctus TaxID=1462730 RepID=UPI00195EAFF7|nr:hypothetical protein [Sodalis-like endosymbiont of Proechinophthirus fluctus]